MEFLTVEQFVENVVNQFGFNVLLKEEHITKTDKLKKYRQYEDGEEVKAELASMLNNFVNGYKNNDYITKIDFHASRSPGLSNYIEINFNAPFGSKPWLSHMKIRVSDHPKMNDRKVDEYIHLEGKSVEDIEKDLDKIINKRVRRLQREDQLPTAQNENIRRNNDMKLRINENELSDNINSNKLFIEDKEYIENVFNTLRQGQDYLRPLHKYNNETWKDIVADVRKIINADNNVSIENTIKEEYNDIAPDDFLYEWLRDLLDDIDCKGHNSKYEKYAETLSLLIRGETFWW